MDLRELMKLGEEDIQKYLYSHIEELKTWWAIRKGSKYSQGRGLFHCIGVNSGFRTREGKIRKKLPHVSFLSLRQTKEAFIIFVRGECRLRVYINFYLEEISVDKDDNR